MGARPVTALVSIDSSVEAVAPSDSLVSGATRGAPPRRRLGRTVGVLSSVNVVVLLATLITGPLQAHALGPSGRGQVAEVLVPVALLSVLGEFGLGTFAMREAAQGTSPGALVGTVAPILILIGVVLAAAASPIAQLLVGARQPVHGLLVLGLMLVPVGLLTNMLGGVCAGLERWRAYSACRIIPPVGTALIFLVLAGSGNMTVARASYTAFLVGAIALLPLAWGLRRAGRIHFDRALATKGLKFGSRAWLGSLLGTATAQLTQVIMIALTGPFQLGLWAVAWNVASSTDLVSTSVFGAIFPRVAQGDHALAARGSRLTILVVGAVAVCAGAVAPVIVPLVFGPRFGGCVGIVELLLVGVVASAASTVWGALLVGVGRPGLLAAGDLITLGVSVPALLVLLPTLGAFAAAVAYVASSAAVAVFLLVCCVRLSHLPASAYIGVKYSDIMWIWSAVRSRARFMRRRRPASHEAIATP